MVALPAEDGPGASRERAGMAGSGITFISGPGPAAARRAQVAGVGVTQRPRGQGAGRQTAEDVGTPARAAGCRLIRLTLNAARTDSRRIRESPGFPASHAGFKKPLRTKPFVNLGRRPWGMGHLPESLNPEAWMHALFSSRDACRGRVVKRQIRDVERIVGRDLFLAEVERRGWQALENGRHFIICCNTEPIRRVRAGAAPARAGA